MSEENTLQNVVESAAKLLQKPEVHNPGWAEVPFVFIPKKEGGMEVEGLDRFHVPRRKAFQVFRDVESFLAYIERFKTDELQIFGNQKNNTATAIFDYLPADSKDGARFLHCASLKFEHSQKYKRWRELLGNPIAQQVFADFLDEHFRDVISPSGAEMKEIAMSLEGKIDSTFKSAQRLKDESGEQAWKVTIQTKAGQNGELDIPEKITLRIPIWEGGPVEELEARFRIRIKEGGISFILLPDGWEDKERESWDSACEQIQGETGLTVYQEA